MLKPAPYSFEVITNRSSSEEYVMFTPASLAFTLEMTELSVSFEENENSKPWIVNPYPTSPVSGSSFQIRGL